MKSILVGSIGAMLVLVSCAAASGSFFDNFDAYVAGSQMHGQGGWKGWDNNPAAGALVSTAQAASLPNSVEITGASDLVHEFPGTTSGQWVFSAKQYIPSEATGTTYTILLNDYNDGGPYDWSMQDAFNLDTGVVVADNGGGATLPIVKGQWVDLRYDIDLDANTVSEYYGGSLLSTHQWAVTPAAVDAVDLFANGASPVYYDDVRLTQVPEPGTLVLLAAFGVLSGICCLRRR
jgi:hypothetical protein